jgi:hypothetical protein
MWGDEWGHEQLREGGIDARDLLAPPSPLPSIPQDHPIGGAYLAIGEPACSGSDRPQNAFRAEIRLRFSEDQEG